MKRNADLIRAMALAIEDLPPGQNLSKMDGVDAHTFAAHAELMVEARLVDGRILKSYGSEPAAAVIFRLTWDGCDFLDAARSDTLWRKAKDSVISPAASWTFDILKEWLKTEIENGLPTVRGLAN